LTILLTGGTGFIGSHVAATLIARGERVKALVRKTSNVDYLHSLGADLEVGDLKDFESVDRAVRKCNIILHLATAPDWKPSKEHWATNYHGTINVLEAALKRGVQRLVHCSTIGVLGFADETPLNEDSYYFPSRYSPYAITKCEAEKVALAYFRKGVPVSIVRPAQVYGPRDSGTLGLAFQWIQRGIYPLIGDGRALLQPVYVQDVVDALLLAMEIDKARGQIYNIAGEEILSFKDLFSIIINAFGRDTRCLNLPKGVAWALGYLWEVKTRFLGGSTTLTRFRVECATRNMIYNITKAREELGFIPKLALEEGVKRTVEWYLANDEVNH
jgi:nucleoside-diphosphate-sugar epimerase